MFRISLIGAGAISGCHAKTIQERNKEIELVSIADINEEAARKIAPEGVKIYTDYQELLRKTTPDAVVIALPHNLHKEVTIKALKFGAHVYVEKPMAISVAECDEMIAAAEKYRKVLFVGHTQRYFPENITAHNMIRTGKIGNLIWAKDLDIGYYGWEERMPWHLDPKQGGGGLLPNRGVHQIDRLQFFFDSQVEKVLGRAETFWPGSKVDGNVGAMLIFRNGRYAFLMGSGYICAPQYVTELFGIKGAIKTIGGLSLEASFDNKPYIHYPYEGGPGGEVSFYNGFRNIYNSFFEAIQGKKAATDAYYGRQIMAVVEAIYKSTQTGKEIKVKQS
ncbi:MAG: Gfo/Idh/MocA family oxidoreductase [Candidatus Omnitrophota bacterium]